jgi:hypothetical protein
MAKVMNMTEGNAAGLMLRFALPVVLTNLGQQLYQIVDAAIVGRGVGMDALAAVGCTDWTYWMVMWSVSVMTQGFATFVSRYFGKNDREKINKAITTSVYLTLIISVVFAVIGITCARPILVLLRTPAERNILSQAVTYLTVMFGGIIVVAFYNLSAAILRAFGDSKTPLIAMVIAAVLNILLDLLFVLAFRWGVFGAAFGPTILLSLFWRRLTFGGAVAGIVTGAVVDILWLALLKGTGLYEIIPGFAAGLIAAIVVSMITPAPGTLVSPSPETYSPNRPIYCTGWSDNTGDVGETMKADMADALSYSKNLDEATRKSYEDNGYAYAGYFSAMTLVQGLQRIADQGLDFTWENYIYCMEQEPIDITAMGLIDYSNGQRLGVTSMSLAEYTVENGVGVMKQLRPFESIAEIEAK